MPDPLDDFLEFDAAMGSDVVECPHCRAKVPRSLLFDDKIKCPGCGEVFEL